MKKILLLTMILTTLLWPSVGMAQTGDQRCWRKESCTSPDTGGSFVKNKESIAACGGERDAAGLEIGFCLPISPAETAVSFGGKTVFTNVAEFFKYIYQYGIRIAGILSVFMLIVGGVQWLLSGGSPDRIGSAKKRISGAIIGLVIVLVSFTLLNILNPYLVELRVPNVWMINKLGMSPPACKHVEGKKIAVYRSVKEKMNEKQTEAKLKDAKFTIDPSTTTVLAKLKKDPSLAEYGGSVPRCGIEYFVQDAGTQTCLGYVCDKGYTCAPFTLSDDGKRNYSKAGCYTGQIHTYAHLSSAENVIKSSALPGVVQWFVRKLNDPDWVASVDDGFYIYSVCDDDSVGKYFDSEPKYIHWRSQKKSLVFDQYEIWYKDLGGKNWDTLCAPRKTKGIILRWEIDDDDDGDDWNMYIGKDPDNEGHAYAGIWDEVNKEKYLIDINDPFFDFGGIFLEINMSDDLFERLEGDETENTEPKKDKGKTSF